MWKYVLNKMIKQKEATFFIVMIILSFAVSSAAPYLNGKFIDLLTVSKDIHLIVQFALIIVGVGVVGALLSYCSNLTTVKVLTKTTMASIYEGMDNLLETDLVIAEKLDFSYITQRLFQDANVITSFVLSNFLSIFLNGILIVGVLYCFFVIDPLLCLIVVVVLIPYIVLFLALKKPLFDSSEKKKEADSRLFGSIHSIVEQVFSIQLNSRFSGAKKEAQASFTNCFPFILKAGRLSYLFSSIDSIIQTVFQSVLFIFAGIQIAVGNMTVGEFVMINSYFALLLRAVKYYTAIYKQYQDSLASYKRMRAILAYPKILNGEIEIDAINTIEVQNLNYGFSDQKHMVFSNANCVFKKGESYSIIGENGEGKSTLFKILRDAIAKNHNEQCAFCYIWGTNYREYENATVVRQCLYSYYKDFFTLKSKGQIIGTVIVRPAIEAFLNEATIQLMALPNSYVKPVIRSIISFYASFPFKKINLLRIQLPKDFYETNQEFVSSLELSGFSLEALQKNAYLDRDLYSYAVNLKIDS